MAVIATLARTRWPGWAHLPREARDTLVLMAAAGWVVAPHLFRLPPWCAALVLGVMAWRAGIALSGGALPGRLVIAALMVLALGGTWASQGTLVGREPGVMMLVVLISLKTLELRARRDALVVLMLGFFLVLTQFLDSQSIATGVHALLAAWALLTTLVLAHMPTGRPSVSRAASVAGRCALLALPIMVLLFLFFPRVGPLWGHAQPPAAGTGLSATLRLGDIGSLALNDSVAMRVRFPQGAPPAEQLYFRGPVLSNFDGREWVPERPSPPPGSGGGRALPRLRTAVQLLGRPVPYEVTIEPGRLAVVPLLELTPNQPGDAPVVPGWALQQQPDLVWSAAAPVTERLRLQARAWPEFRHLQQGDLLGLREYVRLPPGYNPRALEWAAQLRRDPRLAQADAATLAATLMQHIRANGFAYTLEPGPYGRDAVDEFWFDRRLGFCEHFASAFVVMMRALDVPSRIVTGYQGADAQPVDGYWIVRHSHAHAWAEYWDDSRGWVRVDPTAAAAPDRVRRSANLLAPRGFLGEALAQFDPDLLAGLKRLLEATQNRWNQTVLNYSSARQFQLLRELGFEAPSAADLARVLAGLLVAGSVAAGLWAWITRQRISPWERLHRRVARRLATLGVTVRPSDPPRTRALQVRAELGAAAGELAELLEELDRLRYGSAEAVKPPAAWWQRFRRAARAVRTNPARPGGAAA